jgi:hypothetical protein
MTSDSVVIEVFKSKAKLMPPPRKIKNINHYELGARQVHGKNARLKPQDIIIGKTRESFQ